MARPASQATAGYFPTPGPLIPVIAARLRVEQDWPPPVFLDPCAGTGDALVQLAAEVTGQEPALAAHHCIGVELEGSRAQELLKRLPDGRAFHCDALHVALSGPGASVLFLNPPYDHDPELGRLEHRFLARYLSALLPGGVLVFIVPPPAVATCAATLSAHCSAIELHRFPDPAFQAFRQVVVVARRRATTGPPEPFSVHRLERAAIEPEALPVMGAGPTADPLPVPVASAYLALQPLAVDVTDLLSKSRVFADLAPMGLLPDARKLVGTPRRVAMPPRPAHIVLAVATGLLNGRYLEADDPERHPSILVKGRFDRELQQIGERVDSDGDVTAHICVEQPRLELTILRLDTMAFQHLALGAEPSGAAFLDDPHTQACTADLFRWYSRSLAQVVREQLPVLHDPDDPTHRIRLPTLARKPFRIQAEAIATGLKLLALGRNPQGLGQVGTGKSTVALSIAAALMPEHVENTRRELSRVGFNPAALPRVEHVLILCPPHLLDSWSDQIAAVLPDARVKVVRSPSDLEDPAEFMLLSRETAKLGSAIAGVEGSRCPHCGHPVPAGGARKLASRRLRCTEELLVPANPAGRLVRDLAVRLYPFLPAGEILERLLPFLRTRPAVYARAMTIAAGDAQPADLPEDPSELLGGFLRRLEERSTGHLRQKNPWSSTFWWPMAAGARLASLLGELDRFLAMIENELHERIAREPSLASCAASAEAHLARLRGLAGDYGDDSPSSLALLEGVTGLLLDQAAWKSRPGCGEPLFSATPKPRRYPLARYILRRRPDLFDLLILDEAHQYATSGSAQQRAGHRLVELPGVPTIALTGSLMGGYASSLFRNTWALSSPFREEFRYDDQAAFAREYGFQKMLVPVDHRRRSESTFGRHTDREDLSLQTRRLAEAPGVLPSFIVEHLLPSALVMHKSDLDDELPPRDEEPVPVRPSEAHLDQHLLAEYRRLRGLLLDQIGRDRHTPRAGLLWGALAELPSYLDLASEECGPFELRYPAAAGGDLVARGKGFPASWHSPKERWFLEELSRELELDRRVLVFLRHTGTPAFVHRLQRLILDATGEQPAFLNPSKVPTKRRERWLDGIIDDGCRVLLVHPKAVETGLNNLTAFATALWFEGPDADARVTRQANGRPHRIGQTQPVRILYPYYEDTLQETMLDLVARKISESVRVDGLSLAGALAAAGALTEQQRQDTSAAMAFGEALYKAAVGER